MERCIRDSIILKCLQKRDLAQNPYIYSFVNSFDLFSENLVRASCIIIANLGKFRQEGTIDHPSLVLSYLKFL